MSANDGDLLTADGWKQASRFYTDDSPRAEKLTFQVISNDWSVWPAILHDQEAEVDVGYTPAGQIDASLKYMPPPRSPFMKHAMAYHLKLVTVYNMVYSPDGTATKKPSRTRAWQIDGPPEMPWTTVNTAVRYVLEMREKTANPTIKKNADETLAKLLKIH